MEAGAMTGFDVADIYREHAFLVRIPRTAKEAITIHEVFGGPPKPEDREWRPETVLRAELARAKWDQISGELRSELNRRLREAGRKAGRWSIGDNPVQRLLGKELLVLAWAVEQEAVTAEEVDVAVRNWQGLKPEERWWLYTMTAAATGQAHQVGLGWRGALRQALCFGTGRDLFGLGTLAARGTLPPRENPAFVAPRREGASIFDQPEGTA
jgi:hypothetical protein